MPMEKQVGMGYDHCEAICSGKLKTRQIAREFKNTFSWKDLRVYFVGVWDTVSSVGLVQGDVFLLISSSVVHACHFHHTLALNELQVKFMPEYFHEINSQTGDGKSKYIVTSLGGEHTAILWCTSNSMTSGWHAIEYMSIKYQVSFSGAGDNALQRENNVSGTCLIGKASLYCLLPLSLIMKLNTLLKGSTKDLPLVELMVVCLVPSKKGN
ncbi:hypothetical protein HD554DRAFT_2037945 [Boletus coccyginus]|nr:hypothetical protein HD554DRAFT_2037945 [Boletus coccyginus]